MRIKSINQQHSIWNEIKKVSVKDNYSNASCIASQKTAASKEESPDLQQVSNSLQTVALEMNLSSREIPKQNHLEQTSVRSEISYQAGVLSSQEQADDSDHRRETGSRDQRSRVLPGICVSCVFESRAGRAAPFLCARSQSGSFRVSG